MGKNDFLSPKAVSTSQRACGKGGKSLLSSSCALDTWSA